MVPTWLGNAFAFRGSVLILHPNSGRQAGECRKNIEAEYKYRGRAVDQRGPVVHMLCTVIAS